MSVDELLRASWSGCRPGATPRRRRQARRWSPSKTTASSASSGWRCRACSRPSAAPCRTRPAGSDRNSPPVECACLPAMTDQPSLEYSYPVTGQDQLPLGSPPVTAVCLLVRPATAGARVIWPHRTRESSVIPCGAPAGMRSGAPSSQKVSCPGRTETARKMGSVTGRSSAILTGMQARAGRYYPEMYPCRYSQRTNRRRGVASAGAGGVSSLSGAGKEGRVRAGARRWPAGRAARYAGPRLDRTQRDRTLDQLLKGSALIRAAPRCRTPADGVAAAAT